MMKRGCVLTILGVLLFYFVLWLAGCAQEQLGETAAEVRRRHIRRDRINSLELREDVERAFLGEKPMRLSDKKVVP